MSESGTSGSSFNSSTGGSSLASDNTDSRALASLQTGEAGEADDGSDLDNKKSFQEGVFATLFILSKNRAFDLSLRFAVLKVVLEFLQLFRAIFNSSLPWQIQKDLWIFKAIEWTLFRMIVVHKGSYSTYMGVFYFLVALVLATLAATVCVAVLLKGDEANNVWVKRLITLLQTVAIVVYTIFWPAILDYFVFLLDCDWRSVAGSAVPFAHVYFGGQSCLAMPHLAHMLIAVIMCIVFGGMVLLMSIGTVDLNPVTCSWLATSDGGTCFRILALKMVLVVANSVLDRFLHVQVVIMFIATYFIAHLHLYEMPYYNRWANFIWTGLWCGLVAVMALLLGLVFNENKAGIPAGFAQQMTGSVLTAIFPAVLAGMGCAYVRWRLSQRVTTMLRSAFEQRKAAALAGCTGADERARAGSVVSLMTDLKTVYRFRDERQLSVQMRAMRVWDEDGVPDPEAAQFGEFVIKCGMARMPGNPALLVMYTSFLIECRKDGQGARTHLQLAQKSNPSMLHSYYIYVAAQLAKQLKRDGDGLDLMGYVEYQRNYRSCLRTHKMALMAQRQFWNSMLRDNIVFKDLQHSLYLMDVAEQRAVAVYRRVLERYPQNGRLLKVYGRFLEFVRNDPWTAAKFYAEAQKQGTAESLLSLTASEDGATNLSAAGTIDETVDGLIIINAQGLMLMVNAAAVAMFGYEKGELEGKNVSVLMPQPFSSHHNQFLQRFVDTGVPHIVGVTRPMVALHKDRSMFPISLCAMHLTGVGADQLFIGVVRKSTASGQEDVFRFFTSALGVILCADSSAADAFGVAASDLVGRNFSSLCHDVEAVNKFLAASLDTSSAGIDKQTTLRTQLLHSFLPPIDVELSIVIGGALEDGSDYRSITVQAHVLSEAAAVMVLDHKGRIEYATTKLSVLLGHPVASLTKMDLNALLPQPYCQMHGAWFKDAASMKVQPTGCRAGGVVHLLRANGARQPVTVKMSTREDSASGRITHVVQVTSATEAARMDQQCLMLSINHRGTILDVNTGTPKSLFGFNAAELVGRPLAAVVDVFGLWRHQFGEDDSLLALLAAQSGNDGFASRSTTFWRVGVHLPVKNDSDIAQHAALLSARSSQARGQAHSSLLTALQQHNRLRAACMSFTLLVSADEDQVLEDDKADATPVAQVCLHRSDALTTVLELDKGLAVSRADEAAGLMFGRSTKALLKTPAAGLLGLPASTTFEDLLGSKAAAGKKGVMKASASGAASRMGQTKAVTTRHLGDLKPLALEMQALSHIQGGKTRCLLRLRPLDAASGSAGLAQLLALKQGSVAAGAAAAAAVTEAKVARSASGSDEADSRHGSEDTDGGGGPAARQSDGDGFATMDPSHRVSEWVREASQLPESPPGRAHGQPQRAGKRGSLHSNEEAGESAVYVSASHRAGREPAEGKWGRSKQQHGREFDWDADDGDGVRGGADELQSAAPFRQGGPGSVAESASVGGGSSMGSQSEGGGGSISSAADAAQHDEDLAIDARRAKRLKKLNRLVHSTMAQFATTRWRRRTLFLLGIVLAAHLACFAAVVTQVNTRAENTADAATMAGGIDKFMAVTLRANFLAKCWLPQFTGMWLCSRQNMDTYVRKLNRNIGLAQNAHRSLYLGSSGLKPFKDKRLLRYWTYEQLPESRYFLDTLTGTKQTINSTRTLWEMGNVLLASAQEVQFSATAWQATNDTSNVSTIQQTASWQYVYKNGPGSVFKGYSWSLDTFVDYVWNDLTTLSYALVALLIVEAVVVQMSCMIYEFYLLQQANVSHMRLFSVFLALPSATVRLMVQRQVVIDDEGRAGDAEDEDDIDLAEGGGGGGTASVADGQGDASAAADKKPQKSVRVAADVAGDDDDDDSPKSPAKSRKESRGGKAKAAAASKAAASKKPQLTGWALARKNVSKRLFGWLDPKFKRNGKRLQASSSLVWRFMVPLLLWVASVAVIYGVSYDKLQGLQAPLAALDLSAHVMYRVALCRLYANFLAFSTSAASNARNRASLVEQIDLMRQEYTTLLYGGPMLLQAQVSFVPISPPAAFSDQRISDLFFQTSACLKSDQSTCFPPGSENYAITHSGLDALVNRFLDEITLFSKLPDDLAWGNHTSYEWLLKVGAEDMYDGLYQASGLFVGWTAARFNSVVQLHIILLVVSLVCMVLFIFMLYRPYVKQQHRESKAVVGVLSQLPAETDVEGHIKSCVLGIVKPADGNRSMLDPSAMMMMGGGGPGGVGGVINPAAAGMMMVPAGGTKSSSAGWFGSRRVSNSNAGAYQQQQQQQMMLMAMDYGSGGAYIPPPAAAVRG